jgi:hypothetical protein
MAVEIFDGEKWSAVEPPYTTDFGYKSWSPYYESKRWDDPRPDPTTRQYVVFAFLANVRNGFQIEPQFPGRGVPPDSNVDEDRLGEHSFTWASFAELLDAPWDMVIDGEQPLLKCQFRRWLLEMASSLEIENIAPKDARVILGFNS